MRVFELDYSEQMGLNGTLLVETEPDYHLLNYDGQLHRIALPYTCYAVSASKPDETYLHRGGGATFYRLWRVANRTTPLEAKMRAKLVCPPLPNFYPAGSACLGHGGNTHRASMHDAINLLWERGFNYELAYFIYHPVYQAIEAAMCETRGRQKEPLHSRWKMAEEVFSYWEEAYDLTTIMYLPWDEKKATVPEENDAGGWPISFSFEVGAEVTSEVLTAVTA